MAIGFDSTVGNLGVATSGNAVFGSVTNGLAMFMVGADTDTVTAVSVNSVSGTLREKGAPSGGQVRYIFSVPVGTVSGSLPWTITGDHGDGAISMYSGVDQITPVHLTTASTVVAQNSVSCTLTPTIADTWAIAVTGKNGACAVDGLTNITNRYSTASANAFQLGDSGGTLTISVAFTQTVTSSGCAQNHYLSQVLIAPSATTVSTKNLAALGVG